MLRTWHAAKPKKKPNYDKDENLDGCGNHSSLQVIVDELDCGVNPIKVHKLLITAGEMEKRKIYESATADEVLSLWKAGKAFHIL